MNLKAFVRRVVQVVGTATILVFPAATPAFGQSIGHVPGRILVKFNEGTPELNAIADLASIGGRQNGEIPHTGIRVVSLPGNANIHALQNYLKNRPNVEFAEPDEIIQPSAAPNDPYLSVSWHLSKINAQAGWDLCMGSSSVIIAILDTGCDPTHPDLVNKYVPGWNFYDNNSNTADVFGHGTPVAGCAAAATNNGWGVAGVGYNCKVMPLRISDLNGNGSISAICSALTWAADHGAKVANVSFQVNSSSAVSSAAHYFMSKGGIVMVAAGNSAIVHTNANDPNMFVVDATGANDALMSWSDSGSDIDLAAPGTGIYSTNRGGTIGSWAGTSVSAPLVAGVAGLMYSANPSLTGQQVADLLSQSADDLGTPGRDGTYGAGRLNAGNAVAMALNATPGDSTAPTVGWINPAGGANLQGNVNFQVNASDNVGVSSVSYFVDGVLIGSTGTSPFSIGWNSSSVGNGAHNLTVTAYDAANNSASNTIAVTVNNAGDTQAPSVNILSPQATSHVGNNLSVSASASDNIAVVKVEFYVDGVRTATDTSAPYSFSMSTRKWVAGVNHNIQCKAYDAAGNVGLSQIVVVQK